MQSEASEMVKQQFIKLQLGTALQALFRMDAAIEALPDAIADHGGSPGLLDLLIEDLREANAIGRDVISDDTKGSLLEALGIDSPNDLAGTEAYLKYRQISRMKSGSST